MMYMYHSGLNTEAISSICPVRASVAPDCSLVCGLLGADAATTMRLVCAGAQWPVVTANDDCQLWYIAQGLT